MGEIYKYVNGRKLEDHIVAMSGVQRSLGRYAFEIEAYAEVFLAEARAYSIMIGRHIDWDAYVETKRWVGGRGGGSGYDVILNDTEGDGAAYNIERGRRGGGRGDVEFYDPKTGMYAGSMRGLFILERAVQLVADRHRSELRGR